MAGRNALLVYEGSAIKPHPLCREMRVLGELRAAIETAKGRQRAIRSPFFLLPVFRGECIDEFLDDIRPSCQPFRQMVARDPAPHVDRVIDADLFVRLQDI